MESINELEKYAKKIGLLSNSDKSFDEHYRFWKVVSTWKANELINLIQQVEHEKIHSIIEIGCGYGRILQQISEYFRIPLVIGIDNHKPTLKMAKKVAPHCKYMLMDAYNLSFPDDSFDLIILSDIIEHLEHPDLLLKETRRVAKYSIFKIPLEKCLINIKRQYGKQDSSGHLFSLDEKKAINLITQNGFRIINKNVPHNHPDFWGGKRFNRFKFIAPLLRLAAKFLQNYIPKAYELIFGKTLFVFCKNEKVINNENENGKGN
jgi:ubiquinone/menaquinone biosynthesis C-methylase UbiE